MEITNLIHTAEQVNTILKTHPILSGVFGVWLLGVITYVCRSIPAKIKYLAIRYLTVTVSVENVDKMFYGIVRFLEENKIAEKTRTLKINCGRYGGSNRVVLSAGYGSHVFWWKGRPYKLSRSKDASNQTELIKETMSITTIGISQKSVRNILGQCKKYMDEEKDDRVKIFKYGWGQWLEVQPVPDRDMNTICIDSNIKNKLIQHINSFIDNKEFYVEKAIPYRTGILLHGPPGTGKTSIIKALAHKYNRSIYSLSVKSMTDETLFKAFTEIDSSSIVVIEDVDSLKAAVSRDDDSLKGTITTSGLLNTIDGMFQASGTILIISTNHPEKLDKALIRPGRCDLKLELGPCNQDVVEQMYRRFYNEDKTIMEFRDAITPADVENIAIANMNNPEGFLREIKI